MSFAVTSDPAVRARPLAGAVAVMAVIGLVVRLALSRAPLANDEIWSLDNLRPLAHAGRVLWGVSHDNNHFLNSLWLYFVWPWTHDSTVLRLISILSGAALIPVMAALGARRGTVAALAAAALTTLSFFQITWDAQARGYASATLALVVAYAALERAWDAPASRARWGFAAAAGLAVFSHLASGPVLVLFCFVTLAELWRRHRRLKIALDQTFALFAPAALAVAPTVAVVVAGYREMGGFVVGFHRDFAAAHVVGAFTNLQLTTLGLDADSHALAMFGLLALPLVEIAAIALCVRPERRIAYATLIFAMPVVALALRVPNTHPPRYYFAASPFLLLLVSEVADFLWSRASVSRISALALVGVLLVGDAASLAKLRDGLAEPWSDAFAVVSDSADPRLATNYAFNVGRSLAHYNRYLGKPIALVADADLCRQRPPWYVAELRGDAADQPTLTLGAPDCALRYQVERVVGRFTPWQSAWALYRLAESP